MASPTLKGITTITWGTSGLAPWATAIVDSISYKPKVDVPEIEDNNGFTAGQVVLDNGFDADIKCLYDSAVSWPTVGSTCTVKSPREAVGKLCLVTAIAEDASRKKEANITVSVTYRPNVSL